MTLTAGIAAAGIYIGGVFFLTKTENTVFQFIIIACMGFGIYYIS